MPNSELLLVTTEAERQVITRVLLTREVQNLIGGEDWNLTEQEETILWQIINRLEKS